MNIYTVKTLADKGFGAFNLYCNGDWLQAFDTMEALETEQRHREEFDVIWNKDHGQTS